VQDPLCSLSLIEELRRHGQVVVGTMRERKTRSTTRVAP
jgi:hypothetical protein